MIIPHDINAEGIATKGSNHLNSVSPVFYRDSGVMNLTSDDFESFAI